VAEGGGAQHAAAGVTLVCPSRRVPAWNTFSPATSSTGRPLMG
jgi:hypothetical protein